VLKYVYGLVSDETDYYLEQALMSITSLKIRMPDAFISLVIDDITDKTLIGKRKNVLGFVNELKVVNIALQFNKKIRSRWLKTSIRKHIDGNFIFIDCDTVICDDLSHIGNLDCDLGAVLDCHILRHGSDAKIIQGNDKILGFSASFVSDKHFNSGVIFCRDTSICHKFFDEWHGLWLSRMKSNIFIDQPSFNQANLNLNNIITEIDGIWNCQISKGGIVFLCDAKIIHYFTSLPGKNPYLLADFSLLHKISEIGIDEEIIKYLSHPKRIFSLNTRIEVRKVRDIVRDTFINYADTFIKKIKVIFMNR